MYAAMTLLTDPMVVVLPDDHPLARRPGPIRLEELGPEAWVTIRRTPITATSAGFEPRVRFQTESYDVAQALVSTGSGSRWCPGWR